MGCYLLVNFYQLEFGLVVEWHHVLQVYIAGIESCS
jgi:hypothetical protein